MTERPKAARIAHYLLSNTRDEEIDCDRFLELLPQYLDGNVDSATLREKLEHHARVCPECTEELAILKRALGIE
ncbi:MAG: zf-HC2 domain-containing protein [Kofleriaceae bacterium]